MADPHEILASAPTSPTKEQRRRREEEEEEEEEVVRKNDFLFTPYLMRSITYSFSIDSL